MRPADPNWRDRVHRIFDAATFVRHLGIELVDCEPGRCDSALVLADHLRQQDGYAHAGVQTTLADHTAGAAAGSLMPPDRIVLSIEFKVHLLRPAIGQRLVCRATVIKPGERFSVVEADVFAEADGLTKLTAKLLGTMAYVSTAGRDA